MSQHATSAFGEELRRLMAGRGVSLRQLAKTAHYDAGYLSKVINGHKPPSLEVAAAVDRALRAGGALETLVLQSRPTTTLPPGRSPLSLPSGGQPGLEVASPVPQGAVRVTADDVVAMRGMLAAVTLSERQLGGPRVRAQATGYLRTVVEPCLRGAAADGVFRDLCALAVEFSLRVASMQLDVGDAAASRAALRAALPLAHETGSPVVVAWVLSRFGEQDMHDGDIERALAYTGGAAAMARSSPPCARSFILAKHALALSMTGDCPQTLRVLAQAHDSYERAGSAGEPEWMASYGIEHLQHDESRCLNHLGMGDRAVRAAEESMRARRHRRPRAFSLAVQAIGHVHGKAKDVDRACQLGHELAAITSQLASERLKAQLANLLDTLRPYHQVPAVQDLAEAARAALASPQ
ncbi:MAG TPA: helix-turn-helix transcriptional regulator [Streptosporangiaceae bacterium]|nr:helix-turn-helix transcriptional regulator [Streptosporangiaceae bacterium]